MIHRANLSLAMSCSDAHLAQDPHDGARLARFRLQVEEAWQTTTDHVKKNPHEKEATPEEAGGRVWAAHNRAFATSDQTLRRYDDDEDDENIDHDPKKKKNIAAIEHTCAWRQMFFQHAHLDRLFLRHPAPGDDADNPPLAPEHASPGAFHTLVSSLREGKMIVAPYLDATRHTVVVLRPGREDNTSPVDVQVQTVVYTLERALAEARQRRCGLRRPLTLVVDASGVGLRRAPSREAATHVLDVVQRHYLSAIDTVLVVHARLVFRVFWHMLRPVLSHEARARVTFVSTPGDMGRYFDLDVLDTGLGGTGSRVGGSTRDFDPVTYVRATPVFGP